jgi:hypothetical protein
MWRVNFGAAVWKNRSFAVLKNVPSPRAIAGSWPSLASALLKRLGVEAPVLPGYDPSRAETLPFEDVVVAYIERLRAERAAENPDARD